MNEALTLEKALDLLREHRRKVETYRMEWRPHWMCDCDPSEQCGACPCGLEGHLVLMGEGLERFGGVYCARCAVDIRVLVELLGESVDLEVIQEASARQREEEKEASGGEDPYFLDGEALLELCLRILDEHEEELAELKKDWKPNCYCEEGERYCGKCACGAEGHTQHFPGPFPLTAAWCDDCSLEIGYLAETLGVGYGVSVLMEAARIRRKR